jgi:putative ATPase
MAIEKREIPSLILWGPPGTGKTTLAFLIASSTGLPFVPFSAVTSGIKEVKEVIQEAQEKRRLSGTKLILFVDELHRFNKAQQDAFLPYVERGTILFIGATTENPSFEVIAPLLSRCKVLTLSPLSEEELGLILERALKDQERGLGKLHVGADSLAIRFIARLAGGDARAALNTLELACQLAPLGPSGGRRISLELAQEAGQRRAFLYDKAGEEHYNLISALHKSLRGGDPDAALYWLARMLLSGEDPLYIARRLVRFAAEDVGLADPSALGLAVSAMQAYHLLGSPEGELALAQSAIYLALAPKSNASYLAFEEAKRDAQEGPTSPVPLHLRDAPTELMAELGYGSSYRYPHDFPDAYVEQDYLPDALKGRVYYRPADRGLEAEIQKKLEAWRSRMKA